jgi:hypothetical protein
MNNSVVVPTTEHRQVVIDAIVAISCVIMMIFRLIERCGIMEKVLFFNKTQFPCDLHWSSSIEKYQIATHHNLV